ncbi:MAG TPA: glycosyltransferase family 2 protein [Polyangiaceae bacterium]|nr:glycosyltransferase family 2 protein [Polyangiaceae bacterium]
MADSNPRVLIVIPTLNEAVHIEAVVDRVLEEPPTPYLKAVVVDGGSSDPTCAIVTALAARHRSLHLIHNPRRIQSAAINLAARRFGHDADVLVRCDAHAIYPRGFVARLLSTLQKTGADAVVVPLDSLGRTPLQKAIAWVSNSAIGTGGAKHRAGNFSGFVDHGHHAAFRMETFRKAGGYDETFSHNEDAEFDCRQRALGGRLYLDSEIRVGYHPRAALKSLFAQYYRYGSGRSRTARRHPHSLRARQLAVPLHLAACAIAIIGAPWCSWLLVWPAFYLAVLAGTAFWFVIRERSLNGVLTAPAAAVMHFAWGAGFLAGLITRRERSWYPTMIMPVQSRKSR